MGAVWSPEAEQSPAAAFSSRLGSHSLLQLSGPGSVEITVARRGPRHSRARTSPSHIRVTPLSTGRRLGRCSAMALGVGRERQGRIRSRNRRRAGARAAPPQPTQQQRKHRPASPPHLARARRSPAPNLLPSLRSRRRCQTRQAPFSRSLPRRPHHCRYRPRVCLQPRSKSRRSRFRCLRRRFPKPFCTDGGRKIPLHRVSTRT
jgi:hypothetical protein